MPFALNKKYTVNGKLKLFFPKINTFSDMETHRRISEIFRKTFHDWVMDCQDE
jgi:hypothetical protein